MTTRFSKELREEREKLVKDRGPSSRQQSYQHVYWDNIGNILGQPFDSTKIPLSKLYQMRRDPMISFALHFIKVPLITTPWYVKCEDAQIAAFVDKALRRIYGDLVLQYMNSLDFGFSAMVKRFEEFPVDGTYIDPNDPDQKEKKIWAEGKIDPIIWRSFVPLAPDQVNPEWNKSNGEFKGIVYDVEGDYNLGFPTASIKENAKAKLVPLEHSLWATNDKQSVFGSIWGYPRIGHAFRYWWSYWYWWALLDRHVEKDADPPAVVRYPQVSEDEVEDGEAIDYRSIALGIGEQARSGSTIAMPSEPHESEMEPGKMSANLRWDIDFVKGNTNFREFTELFDRLEILKLRSIWVPEQAFMEGRGGSSSRNVAETMGESFDKSQTVLWQEFASHVTKYVIPQIIEKNFPQKAPITAELTSGGFSSEELEISKLLVTIIGQNNPNDLGADIHKIMERLNVPTLSAEQLEAKKQKAIEEAQAMMPPEVAPVPGSAAGTVKTPNGPGVESPVKGGAAANSTTGFSVQYIQPRQKIHLSEARYESNLPDIPPFKDPVLVSFSKQLRSVWSEILEESYQSFASYVEREREYLQMNDYVVALSENPGYLHLDAKLVPNKPNKTNWVEKLGGLPKKIADMAGDLIDERGFSVSHAIATAVNAAKRLAVKHKEWAAALAKWERMKAQASKALGEDFDYLLAFADEDDADERAEKFISRWISATGNAGERSRDLFKKIIKRTADEELKRTKSKTNFDEEAEAVASWIEDHGAEILVGIDNTIRNELRTFLAEQIRAGKDTTEMADAIREHFEEWPDWKADRIARTETVMAYNQAVLLAAKQTGFNRVQAIDARKGPTDEDCEDRNGQFFSVDEALTIFDHPNGTLTWRLAPGTNLSVSRVDPVEGKVAWYEPKTEIIYLAHNIDPDLEEKYLLSLGEWLRSPSK